MRARPLPVPVFDGSTLTPALPPAAALDDPAALADPFPVVGTLGPVRRCKEVIKVSCAFVNGACSSSRFKSGAGVDFSDDAMVMILERNSCKNN